MTTNTRVWLHGLAAAFVGTAANSVSTMLVAPATFNLTSMHGFKNVLLSSLVSGFVATGLYLKTSPLPPLKVTTDSLKVSDGTNTVEATTTTSTPVTPK